MILVADGGSTSCDWVCLNPQTLTITHRFKTDGLNPAYSSRIELEQVLSDSIDRLNIQIDVSEIYFFGAGCNSHVFSDKLNKIFKKHFPSASKIKIQGDIKGAVYACTDEPGVVGILGTGSNICFYNGSEIRTNIESLGYSIMDDGAGSALGRLLLRAYFYNQLTSDISDKLSSNYNVDPDYVKENIYHKAFPGKFLATYAKFVFDNLDSPILEQILKQNIESFFDTHVVQYQDELKNAPLHFVGSVAHYSRKQIEEICSSRGFELGKIIQSPIDALAQNINYYI